MALSLGLRPSKAGAQASPVGVIARYSHARRHPAPVIQALETYTPPINLGFCCFDAAWPCALQGTQRSACIARAGVVTNRVTPPGWGADRPDLSILWAPWASQIVTWHAAPSPDRELPHESPPPRGLARRLQMKGCAVTH